MFLHAQMLSLLIWLPVFGAVVVCFFHKPEHSNLARVFSLIISLLSLALCVLMIVQFNNHTSNMQFQENLPWIASLKIRYTLGVDGISMPLIVLTCFTTLIVVLASWNMVEKNVAQSAA